MRGHGDDRHVGTGRLLQEADLPGGLMAVHYGHLHVHQDDVVAALLAGIDRRQSVSDDGYRVAGAFQQPDDEPLVDKIILGGEEAKRACGGVRQKRFFAVRDDFSRRLV